MKQRVGFDVKEMARLEAEIFKVTQKRNFFSVALTKLLMHETQIVPGQLEKGTTLREVVDSFKTAAHATKEAQHWQRGRSGRRLMLM